MAYNQSLKDIEMDWQNIQSLIIHFHGAIDALAPCNDNIEFSKMHIQQKWLTAIVDKDDAHIVVYENIP